MSWKVPKSWQSASGEPAFCSSPGDPYPRLTALQRHIEAGTLLVDIGTDHARLPIAALQSDRCTAAIGIDIHADPLAGARLRALAAGVGSRLILHQDDALTNLCIRVPCTIVGAGILGLPYAFYHSGGWLALGYSAAPSWSKCPPYVFDVHATCDCF